MTTDKIEKVTAPDITRLRAYVLRYDAEGDKLSRHLGGGGGDGHDDAITIAKYGVCRAMSAWCRARLCQMEGYEGHARLRP